MDHRAGQIAELREMLERKADEIPPLRKPPGAMLRRARRRAVRNVAVAALVVAALAVGTYTAVQAVAGSPAIEPVGSPPIGPAHSPASGPVRSPTSLPSACTSGDLRIAFDFAGGAGAGSRAGVILFRNSSGLTCTLTGRIAGARIVAANGKTSALRLRPDPAAWQLTASPSPPPNWPLVTIRPGEQAAVRATWGNWCGEQAASLTWQFDLPNGRGTVNALVPVSQAGGLPLCAAPKSPSQLHTGPFEPASDVGHQ